MRASKKLLISTKLVLNRNLLPTLSLRTQKLLDGLRKNDNGPSNTSNDESDLGSHSNDEESLAEDSDDSHETLATEDMLTWAQADDPVLARYKGDIAQMPQDYDTGFGQLTKQQASGRQQRRDTAAVRDENDQWRFILAKKLYFERQKITREQYYELAGVKDLPQPPRYPQKKLPVVWPRESADKLEAWALCDPEKNDPLNPLRHPRAAEYWKTCDPNEKMSQNPNKKPTTSDPSRQVLHTLQSTLISTPCAPRNGSSPLFFQTPNTHPRHQSLSPLENPRSKRPRSRTEKGIIWDDEEGPLAKIRRLEAGKDGRRNGGNGIGKGGNGRSGRREKKQS